MTFPARPKHPAATTRFVVDWTLWLGADTISSVVWTITGALTQVSTSFTTLAATIFVSGGVLGDVVTINCKITTAAGRVNDFSFQVLLTLAALPSA
jgi:hypothetical protein